MAGDRGLAFVMIGLIGSTIVWVGTSHGPRIKPAINAYALARKAPAIRDVPTLRPNPPENKSPKARLREIAPLD